MSLRGGWTSPSCRPYPAAEVASSSSASVIILTAPQAALVHTAVVCVLDMPFVADVQLAQQGLDHGGLRFRSQRSLLLMIAPDQPRGHSDPVGALVTGAPGGLLGI